MKFVLSLLLATNLFASEINLSETGDLIEFLYGQTTGEEISIGDSEYLFAIVTSDDSWKVDLNLYAFSINKSYSYIVGFNADNTLNKIDSTQDLEELITVDDIENDDQEITVPNFQLWHVEQLEYGVPIKTTGHRQVLNLKLINKENTPLVIIDYLVSGVTGKRRQLKLHVDTSNNRFRLFTEDGILVERMHFVPRFNFIGLKVGVEEVLFNADALARLEELKLEEDEG